jgi:hypothetical protein
MNWWSAIHENLFILNKLAQCRKHTPFVNNLTRGFSYLLEEGLPQELF